MAVYNTLDPGFAFNENRAILLAYSWDTEAQITFSKHKEELPYSLFKALAMPIPGANSAVMPDLVFNGGIATPVEQAFRMTSKKDLETGAQFSPVNRLENPYISTFSEEGHIPGCFCENEWVSMGSGFIRKLGKNPVVHDGFAGADFSSQVCAVTKH